MADFNEAVKLTLQHEGGYSNDSSDPGGATNMGIEQQDIPDWPIESLTVAQAVNYYQETYWKPLYSDITSQAEANKLFDLGVLFGVGTAVLILQKVLGIKPDGVFGPASLTALNEKGDAALPLYKAKMRAHAVALVAANSKLEKFLDGWQTRIES